MIKRNIERSSQHLLVLCIHFWILVHNPDSARLRLLVVGSDERQRFVPGVEAQIPEALQTKTNYIPKPTPFNFTRSLTTGLPVNSQIETLVTFSSNSSLRVLHKRIKKLIALHSQILVIFLFQRRKVVGWLFWVRTNRKLRGESYVYFNWFLGL